MNILIVEDDPVQYDFLANSLKERSNFPNATISRIVTESAFREKFSDIEKSNPDVIMVDVMLRWADPSPNMVLPPKEIQDEGFYRAGIRCIKMLSNSKKTRSIPTLIYTVLDKEDLENDLKELPNVKYITKDFDAKKVKEAIRSVLRK